MVITPNDNSLNREEDVKILADGLIANFGAGASVIAQQQIDLSTGDIKVSWKMIAKAITDKMN